MPNTQQSAGQILLPKDQKCRLTAEQESFHRHTGEARYSVVRFTPEKTTRWAGLTAAEVARLQKFFLGDMNEIAEMTASVYREQLKKAVAA